MSASKTQICGYVHIFHKVGEARTRVQEYVSDTEEHADINASLLAHRLAAS